MRQYDVFTRITTSILALSALCMLYGCGRVAPKGAPVSIEYDISYSDGNGSNGTHYLLALPEGGILGEDGAEFTVRSDNGGGFEYSCLLGGDVLSDVGRIIDDNGVAGWDGYSKVKKKSNAEKSFRLTAVYPDGTRIEADGINAFPRGWDKGSSALNGFFDGLLDEESIIAAGGRLAPQTDPDDDSVPVIVDLLNYTVLSDGTSEVTSYMGGADGGAVSVPDEKDGRIVASIGGRAFSGSDVVSVRMGSYITKIGESCFEDCASLSEAAVPSELVSVPRRAFAGCVSLKTAVMPSMVQFIEPQAFSGCTSLTEVSLNEGLLSIGSQVFGGCESLSSVNIPYSVTYIGDDAFDGCSDKLELLVYPDSYGLEYAKEHSIPYTEYKISGGMR